MIVLLSLPPHQSLIPDIKPSQDAVMDLHPDDSQLSGDEDTPTTREDQGLDKDLKIRRTVTQVGATCIKPLCLTQDECRLELRFWCTTATHVLPVLEVLQGVRWVTCLVGYWITQTSM